MIEQERILEECLSKQPRISLAALPTPITEAPSLSRKLGGVRILFKRDDLTGLALGGNKVRMVEFVMADMMRRGAEVVVLGGPVDGNYFSVAVAAARKLGLRTIFLLRGRKTKNLQGNLYLDRVLGAEIRFFEYASQAEVKEKARAEASTLREQGQRAYVIEGDHPLEALGYVGCALELSRQFRALSLTVDHVFVASNGATLAGLLMGSTYLQEKSRLTGISPELTNEPSNQRVIRLANAAAELLDLDLTMQSTDFAVFDNYTDATYPSFTSESLEAVRLVAETEGIFVEPVHTGKAMAGLVDQIARGRVKPGETVVFIHTGGIPAVFSYAREILGACAGLVSEDDGGGG